MKSAIVALAILGCAFATGDEKTASVVRSNYEQSPEGFLFAYETENGISAQAEGKLKPLGKDEVALEVNGANQYKSPEGQTFSLTYVANENGYQPQADFLPTPPPPQPIPDYILRSLEYIAAHPYTEKKL